MIKDNAFGVLPHLSLMLMLAANTASPLKLTNMSAPAVIDYKEDMRLDCKFDMGGEQLYAVKWYKDENEFFRFMPNQTPHKLFFPVFGVHPASVTCDNTRCQIVLNSLLRIKSSGAYRCEVSSEAPAFRLASETHNVTVAALPKDNPAIDGLDDSYFEGDILTAKCISSLSDPPQLITWFINKEQVPAKFVRDMKRSKPNEDGLVSTSQLLRFVVERNYTQGKYVELSCVSAFANTPASARRTTANVAIFDHDSQINNPRYTYWHTSSANDLVSAAAAAAHPLLAAVFAYVFR